MLRPLSIQFLPWCGPSTAHAFLKIFGCCSHTFITNKSSISGSRNWNTDFQGSFDLPAWVHAHHQAGWSAAIAGWKLVEAMGVELGCSVSRSFLLWFKFVWITVVYDVCRFLAMNVDFFPALRCVVSYNSGILHSQCILGDCHILDSKRQGVAPESIFSTQAQNSCKWSNILHRKHKIVASEAIFSTASTK